MSVIDQVIAAVTPAESERARARARSDAHAVAAPGEWLSLVLEDHAQIEMAFAALQAAASAGRRLEAQRELAEILMAHAIAEESVLYPALALHDAKSCAETAYGEQSTVKIQMAALEELDPMSREYAKQLEQIRADVAHHIYQEESTWFLELQARLSPADEARLTGRYLEEFERYLGGGGSTALSEDDVIDVDVLS